MVIDPKIGSILKEGARRGRNQPDLMGNLNGNRGREGECDRETLIADGSPVQTSGLARKSDSVGLRAPRSIGGFPASDHTTPTHRCRHPTASCQAQRAASQDLSSFAPLVARVWHRLPRHLLRDRFRESHEIAAELAQGELPPLQRDPF